MKMTHHKAIHKTLTKAGYKASHATKMIGGMKKVEKEHGIKPESAAHEKKEMKAISTLAKMHKGTSAKTRGRPTKEKMGY